jgi:non-ribosomal peptide synthetase component F
MTLSGRELPVEGIEDSVGLYINTLPVIYECRRRPVIEGMRELQGTINEVTSRGYKKLGTLQKGGGRLFNSIFVYENYPIPEGIAGGLETSGIRGIEKLDYPLGVVVTEEMGGLKIHIKYAGELFERERIRELLEGMRSTLEQAVRTRTIREEELRHVGEEDYNRIVYEWNRTEAEYPADKTITALFEEQVTRTPERTAVVYGDTRLSYRELNEEANRLAHYLLREYAVKPGDIIALCLDRSEKMILAILAVLKAGCAWAPILPAYPDERIGYILRDTGAKVLLTNGSRREQMKGLAGDTPVVCVDESIPQGEDPAADRANPGAPIGAGNLAYVIYTSGTTGQPKGVMIEHRSFINLIHSVYPRFGLSHDIDEVILFLRNMYSICPSNSCSWPY